MLAYVESRTTSIDKGAPSPQQTLGAHDDERFSEGEFDLSAQGVTVIGGRSAVEDDPVGLMQLLQAHVFRVRRGQFCRHYIRVVRTHLEEPVRRLRK